MRRKFLKAIVSLALAAALVLPCGVAVSAEEEEERQLSRPGEVCGYDYKNFYDAFKVPTQVYRSGGEYFIADAYNHQMLYTTNYGRAPWDWNVMGDKLFRPHAIASDGTIYVVVDTDNNRVVTYAKNEVGFQVVECFDNVGVRPHYVEYDAATRQFYVWSSMTGTMYIYKRNAKNLQLKLVRTAYIKALDGYYTRSFTIDGNNIYLPSMGRNAIYVVNKQNFKVKAVYGVSAELGGMVQVRHEQHYYYLVTSSDAAGDQTKATFVRSKSLSGFVEGKYEDLMGKFPELDGVPYYITHLEDGHYFTPVIAYRNGSYICRFDITNDEITDILYLKYDGE